MIKLMLSGLNMIGKNKIKVSMNIPCLTQNVHLLHFKIKGTKKVNGENKQKYS